MRKFHTAILTFALVLPVAGHVLNLSVGARTLQNEGTADQRVLRVPGTRQRRVRSDRRRGPGIGSAYAEAGRSAGRGGAGFGKNIAQGRVVRAGKEFGKGMGGFGKHTGIGTARVGKRIGTGTAKVGKGIGKGTAGVAKRVFTP